MSKVKNMLGSAGWLAVFSLLLWEGIAWLEGIQRGLLSSLWGSLAMLAFLPLVFVCSEAYGAFRKNHRPQMLAAVLVCLALAATSAVYAGLNIANLRTGDASFAEWKAAVTARCQSLPKPATTSAAVQIEQPIWMLKNGTFDPESADQQLREKTAAERDSLVQVIALVDEKRYVQGDYVSADWMKTQTGIVAVQYTWFASLCDLKQGRILAEKGFVGPPPPDTAGYVSSNKPEAIGTRPVADYQAWLSTMTGK